MSERGVHVAATTDELMFAGRGPRPDADVSWRWFPGWWPILDTELRLDRLRWDGTAVVVRDQGQLDQLDRVALQGEDERYFEREQAKAVLGLILDQFNVLRSALGLPPISVAQAKAAYRAKLNR